MKKQLNQLRRFFARTSAKRLNATTAREALPGTYDDEDNDTRLSGAFVVVLLLHIVALVGVFAFSRVKERGTGNAQGNPANQPAQAPAIAPAALAQGDQNATTGEVSQLPPLPPAGQLSLPVGTGGRSYVVKAGDTLTKIALAYGATPADIVAANQLRSGDDLKIGQELQIPVARTAPPADVKATAHSDVKAAPPSKITPSTYKIKKGDTLVGIARELGVDYKDLAELNKIKDPKKIQINQTLKVPGKH